MRTPQDILVEKISTLARALDVLNITAGYPNATKELIDARAELALRLKDECLKL
jgi:hypothetical protein